MNNLIAKVAELRKLEAKATRKHGVGAACDDIDLQMNVEIRDAAPGLLAALGKVHEGDADEIDYAIDIVSQHENDDDTITCLRRYADLARLMEDEYAT